MILEVEAVNMFEQLKAWVNLNSGLWIESPRKKAFQVNTNKFRINIKTPDKIHFEFDSGTGIDFEYWRFVEAIKFIYLFI